LLASILSAAARPGMRDSMTVRASQRTNVAAMIIHDAIGACNSRHGLVRRNLTKQQRHEIGKAKISYVMGNLNEEDLRRTVEHALTPVDTLVPPPTSDNTR
jgi:hypothetical protein